MSLVSLRLVKFTCLDPNGDPLIKWLIHLNYWSVPVRYRIEAAKCFLPLDLEFDLKEKLGLPLDDRTKKVFSKLVDSDMGLSLKSFGFCNHDWDDPETCCGKLLQLNLARVQDSERFKAIKYAFDPRIQYLIGARQYPN